LKQSRYVALKKLMLVFSFGKTEKPHEKESETPFEKKPCEHITIVVGYFKLASVKQLCLSHMSISVKYKTIITLK